MSRAPLILAAAAAVALAGCRTPFEARDDEPLRRSVERAIDRELAGVAEPDPRLVTTQPPGDVEGELSGRRDELDDLGPRVRGDAPYRAALGEDLTGAPQREVVISLRSAIVSAVRRNLAIQEARLQPAIREADVVAAEAAFDTVLFSSGSFTKTDQPTTTPLVETDMGLIQVGTPFRGAETWRFETGVRKRLVSGGEVVVSTDFDRTRDRTPGFQPFPDPAYSTGVRVGVVQPLLRGFGSEVATASIRLSRNAERSSIQDLRAALLAAVEETERAYWDLAVAWRTLAIAEWLVEVGEKDRDVLGRRRDYDARLAEYADAVARVEQRKADVIRARRLIRATSDRLKTLINDEDVTVGSEALLQPIDVPAEVPIEYSLREAMLTAVRRRPEIQQAILRIDDTAIREAVADNARLPLLDLSAEMAYFGLSDDAGEGYEQIGDGTFIDYVVGLQFEVPIGNRAAEAGFRRARLERSAAVVGYRRAVQEIILDVKSALRDVVTNFELIQATRSFRIAQAENLRALLVEETTLAALSPEFLNLKFQQQERLADAQQQEIDAHANFAKAIAALYRAMGIGLEMNQIEVEIDDEPPARTGGDAPDR